MEILGIGPVEFLFIIIILVLVLGPTELGTLGRKTGEFIRKMRMSETWILLANLSRTIRNLPTVLADEVGMDELLEDVVPGRNRRTIAPPRRPGDGTSRADLPTVRADAYPAWTTPPAASEETQLAAEQDTTQDTSTEVKPADKPDADQGSTG